MDPFVPGPREEDSWFNDDQLAHMARADDVDELNSPIPTTMISNGEFVPARQTREQLEVESRLSELADDASRKLGLRRRGSLRRPAG